MKIEGQTAVISGGCSGLGLATAKYLISLGARVILLDINEQNGEKAVKALSPSNAHFIKTDISNEEDVKTAYEKAGSVFTAPRIYVHSAGIGYAEMTVTSKSLHRTKAFQLVVSVNLIGTFLCCKYAANALRSLPVQGRERGVIINVSSVAATEGQRGQIAYSASKAGVMGMTLPMARDLGRFKIRVVTIAPGVFETPMVSGMSKKFYESMASQAATGQLGTPADFANMVGGVISNEYLNGSTIRLDGGLHLPHL